MDLPTYTNIWRIEKRLYKLYDLRLPTPLPIVWIGVFVGVSAPWWVFLQLVGLKFDAPWHVIYLVPPGVITWLSTRPVIEGKRLTELLQSQSRYLSEPRTWCRLAPVSEPDEVVFHGRVWRASRRTVPRRARHAQPAPMFARAAASAKLSVKLPQKSPEPLKRRVPGTVRPAVAAAAAAIPAEPTPIPPVAEPTVRPSWGTATAKAPAIPVFVPQEPRKPEPRRPELEKPEPKRPELIKAKPEISEMPEPRRPEPQMPEPRRQESPVAETTAPPIGPDALRRLRRLAAASTETDKSAPSPMSAATSATDSAPPADKAREQHRRGQPPRPPIPERKPERQVSIRAVPALSGQPAAPVPVPRPESKPAEEPKVRRVESVVGRDPQGGWRRIAQVVVGSGGGRTDGTENDEARVRTPITGSRRVVVLGCTGGAGQSTTALLLGHTLARHRDDGVLAVDANTGDHTLTTRIRPESPETLSSFLAVIDQVGTHVGAYTSRCESGLDVLAADTDEGAEQRIADRSAFSDQRIARAMRLLDQQYRVILMDPAAALAARLLPYADQLVLVAPASADAPDAVAMTYDWLDGHGCADLRRRAVMVVNGVSRRSLADVERAEAVARGRCRAIVRVPWEDELAESGPVDLGDLRAGGRRAYVALAGVVASGLTTARGESIVG
ncbi:TcpE family conjugal transfer membrane protein [Acrocarpospora sp. B8E8]|uniref:TcpE family conjugal transfer membrane protein n=1 Tax=Acrocarpospora sp. B8E8 TaxID=3153572 RepID=UPI00325C4F1C